MRRQGGFALLELVVAVLIATLLAIWAAGTLVNKIDEAAAQASAAWMLSIKKAAQAYIERYDGQIKSAIQADALGDRGYSNWAAPALKELKADKLLSAGFPEQSAYGLGVAIIVMRGDTCPDAACRLDVLIHSRKPFSARRTAHVDEQMIARWLMAAQGWGGAVTVSQADRIAGAAFSLPNPPVATMAALPPGTVAMAITWEQMAHIDYLQVGDSRDPDFQGLATVKGDIVSQGSVSAGQYVHVGAQEQASTACSHEGAIARERYGGLLVCRSRRWRSAGGGGGGGFLKNTLYGCSLAGGVSTANPVTGSCTCPLDHEAVLISDSGPHGAPDGRTRGYLCVQ